MDPVAFQQRIARYLQSRAEVHQLRQRRAMQVIDPTHVRLDGKVLTNFCSNNYLGLTHHPRMIQAAQEAAGRLGVGAGAAGLLGGYSDEHQRAETELAAWKGYDAAVLLPSGYQANLTAVQTLAAIPPTGTVRFFADKLVHASLLDAVAQTNCPLRTFPHNHLSRLARLLEKGEPGELQVVLTESIFSMDGDQADLAGLAELKKKFGFVLLVDEAHSTGVYAADGSGLVNAMGYRDLVDVSVVTLSKGLGLIGGAICGSRGFCDAVINAGRGYIYSTSVPAMQGAMLRQAIQLCRQEPERRQRLMDNITRLRRAISQMGLAVPEGSSPIIPVIMGSAERALAAAQQLRDQGLLVMAVRPPTVPPGQSRLRITVSSEHAQCDIDQLIGGLSKLALNSPGDD